MLSTTEAQTIVETIRTANRTNDFTAVDTLSDGDVALALYVIETAKDAADLTVKAFAATAAERTLAADEADRYEIALGNAADLASQVETLRSELYDR